MKSTFTNIYQEKSNPSKANTILRGAYKIHCGVQWGHPAPIKLNGKAPIEL